MRQFNIGDKVILDDQSGTITGFTLKNMVYTYDVRYGHTFMIATDVPGDQIEPWVEDEQ